MEIFLTRLHGFDMLDRRCMRPTTGHLAHIPPIYNIGRPYNLTCCFIDRNDALVLLATCALRGGDENHHCYCGGQTSLSAEYGEPPIEPLISASKNGLEPTLLLWNVDI